MHPLYETEPGRIVIKIALVPKDIHSLSSAERRWLGNGATHVDNSKLALFDRSSKIKVG